VFYHPSTNLQPGQFGPRWRFVHSPPSLFSHRCLHLKCPAQSSLYAGHPCAPFPLFFQKFLCDIHVILFTDTAHHSCVCLCYLDTACASRSLSCAIESIHCVPCFVLLDTCSRAGTLYLKPRLCTPRLPLPCFSLRSSALSLRFLVLTLALNSPHSHHQTSPPLRSQLHPLPAPQAGAHLFRP